MLCDIRIAADDAKFRLPELAHGLIPDSGGTARLFQMCGHGLVSDLVLDHPGARRRGGAAPRDRVAGGAERDDLDDDGACRWPPPSPPCRRWRCGRGARTCSTCRCRTVSKSIHAELLAQMLVYTSEDFAEFKAARAEERAPVYRVA